MQTDSGQNSSMRTLLLVVFLSCAFILNWGLTRLMAFGTPEQTRPIARTLAVIPSLILVVGFLTDTHSSILAGMIGSICLCDAAGAWLNVLYTGVTPHPR